MLYNSLSHTKEWASVVNCFQFCNNFDVVQLADMGKLRPVGCELLSIL